MRLGRWTRWLLAGAGIATILAASGVTGAGKWAAGGRCADTPIPADLLNRFERVRTPCAVLEVLGDPKSICGSCRRAVVDAQNSVDFLLLLAYPILIGAIFWHVTRNKARGPKWLLRLLRGLGALLAVGMLVADLLEDVQLFRISGFRGTLTCGGAQQLTDPLHLLSLVNPLKWKLLTASALVLAALYCALERGVARWVVAGLYLASAILGVVAVNHGEPADFRQLVLVLALAWGGSIALAEGRAIEECRRRLRDLWLVVKPCGFSLFAALLVVLALALLPQGQDLLQRLAEWDTASPTPWYQIVAALLGLFWFGGLAWYTARVALYIIPAGAPRAERRDEPVAAEHAENDERKALQARKARLGRFLKWVPRVIGVLPFAGTAIANLLVYSRFSHSQDPAPGHHLLLAAAVCVAAGALFMVFVIFRRKAINSLLKLLKRDLIGPASDPPTAKSLRELTRDTGVFLALIALAALLIGAALSLRPVEVAPRVGPVGVVFFAVACWLPIGGYLAYLGRQRRFPLITVLLLLSIPFSLVNDNHSIRKRAAARAERPTLEAEFEAWKQMIQAREPNGPHPIVVVAAEGGGASAAFWTASVLAELQDRDQDHSFVHHLFAISSVSGGSLGAAVFTALVADAQRPGAPGLEKVTFSSDVQKVLGGDLLSPTLGSLLSGDLLQRFLPISIPALDRGRALEKTWEEAFRRVDGNHQGFDRSFTGLTAVERAAPAGMGLLPASPSGPPAGAWVPRLVLNGTCVESGKRAITTAFNGRRLDGRPLFADSEVVLDPVRDEGVLDPVRAHDFRLSTAVHNSARFPIISPPGELDGTCAQGGGHLVDGGYFETSGAASALEIVARLKKLREDEEQWPILLIGIFGTPDVEPLPRPTKLLLELTAPLKTLWQTRGARASFSVAALREFAAANGNEQAKPPPPAVVPDSCGQVPRLPRKPASGPLFQFGTCYTDASGRLLIPLGWQLSSFAQSIMVSQLKCGCGEFDNRGELERLLTRLHALRIPPKVTT